MAFNWSREWKGEWGLAVLNIYILTCLSGENSWIINIRREDPKNYELILDIYSKYIFVGATWLENFNQSKWNFLVIYF